MSISYHFLALNKYNFMKCKHDFDFSYLFYKAENAMNNLKIIVCYFRKS